MALVHCTQSVLLKLVNERQMRVVAPIRWHAIPSGAKRATSKQFYIRLEAAKSITFGTAAKRHRANAAGLEERQTCGPMAA